MDNEASVRFSKTLSKNDTGETGAHQAGILVPKNKELLTFFPTLDKSKKNPRYNMPFYDDQKIRWNFNYIYYNNRYYGGTRDEYRLTGMTAFIRQYGLREGDTVYFSKSKDKYAVSYCKNDGMEEKNDGIIKLSNRWRMIRIKNERG